MYRGTTPTLAFRFTEFNPTEAEKIRWTFVNGKQKWVFTEADVETDLNTVTITFT